MMVLLRCIQDENCCLSDKSSEDYILTVLIQIDSTGYNYTIVSISISNPRLSVSFHCTINHRFMLSRIGG